MNSFYITIWTSVRWHSDLSSLTPRMFYSKCIFKGAVMRVSMAGEMVQIKSGCGCERVEQVTTDLTTGEYEIKVATSDLDGQYPEVP